MKLSRSCTVPWLQMCWENEPLMLSRFGWSVLCPWPGETPVPAARELPSRARGSLHLRFGGSQPSSSWWRCSLFTMLELGVEFGLWLCEQRWPNLFWLGFIVNSGDSLRLLTGSKTVKASSLQCTAPRSEQNDFSSGQLKFVLNHELQLKLARL